jgi:hypothetical protein
MASHRWVLLSSAVVLSLSWTIHAQLVSITGNGGGSSASEKFASALSDQIQKQLSAAANSAQIAANVANVALSSATGVSSQGTAKDDLQVSESIRRYQPSPRSDRTGSYSGSDYPEEDEQSSYSSEPSSYGSAPTTFKSGAEAKRGQKTVILAIPVKLALQVPDKNKAAASAADPGYAGQQFGKQSTNHTTKSNTKLPKSAKCKSLLLLAPPPPTPITIA